MNKTRGFVFVATGHEYIPEVMKSVAQLKKIYPDERACIISDQKNEDFSIFDDIILLNKAEVSHSTIDKVRCIRCPYEEVVFLDTDTWMHSKVGQIFDLTKKFDLALLPETKRGWYYDLPEVPRPFAEFNTGVIVFRNSRVVKDFFQQWEDAYWTLRKSQGIKNDQAAFRMVLWHSDLRVAPLPSEYHFLTNSPNYIMWEAHLLHGRGNLENIAHSVNKHLGPRVYLPHVGSFSGYHGKWDWLKKLMDFFWRGLSLVWKKHQDPSKLAPKKWW